MSWNRAKAMNALRSGDLLELGMSANQIRQNLHPAGVVTYTLRATAPARSEGIPRTVPVAEDGSISLTSIPDMEHLSVDALEALMVARRRATSWSYVSAPADLDPAQFCSGPRRTRESSSRPRSRWPRLDLHRVGGHTAFSLLINRSGCPSSSRSRVPPFRLCLRHHRQYRVA